MHGQERLDVAADQDASEVQGTTEGNPPREDDPATAKTSTDQPPIQRQGKDLDEETPRFAGERPIPREPDPPAPALDPTQIPIQRPGPDSDPIVQQHPGTERG